MRRGIQWTMKQHLCVSSNFKRERERKREERKNYRIELKQKWILIVLMKSWMKDFRRGIVSIYLKIYLLINYKKKLSSVSSLMIKKMNFIKGGGEGWSPLQIKFKEIREIIFAFWHYNKIIRWLIRIPFGMWFINPSHHLSYYFTTNSLNIPWKYNNIIIIMINFPVNEYQKEDHKSYYFVRKSNFNKYIFDCY